MKFVLISILTFFWTTFVFYSVPGIVSSLQQSNQHHSCHSPSKESTIEQEDCCTKFHKSETNCGTQKDNHDEKDDCCKTTHCPRTCCQTFVLNLIQVGNFTFGISQLHKVFGELSQSNFKEPYLGVTTPPPNGIPA
jgi:hypothetical protein